MQKSGQELTHKTGKQRGRKCGERKKERLLEGVKNIANTCKYHVLEAGEDEKQRKYRVVEVEKVKKLGEKNVSLWWKVVAVRFPAGPSAEG